MLTEESDVSIKVKSFSAEVYDFVTKPFVPAEWMARIDSHLLRSERQQSTVATIQKVGNLKLNTESKKINLQQGDQVTSLKLTPIEFKILQYLICHCDKVRTREQLALSIWQRKYS